MLKAHPQGSILLVRAQPGSRKQGILGLHGDRLKIAVHAAPNRGKANSALIDVLAAALNVKRNQITLLQGETSQQKAFLIAGLAPTQAQAQLASLRPS
jgi:hypothetical protein